MLRILGGGIILLLVSGCASYGVVENTPVQDVSADAGYSVKSFQEKWRIGDTMLMLAFSGGGTRAAALSYGVLKEMRDTRVSAGGQDVRLLDAVDSISSVSGGSFTAAYTGGFGVVALIAGFAGGLIGGALFVSLYYFGVFVLGACAGWLFGVLITSAAGNTMHVLLFVILALIGGILAVMFQRLIITASTAMIGAWYMVAGAFTFLGSEYTPLKMFSDPDSMTGIDEGPGLVLLLSWLALSVSGMIFQYRYGPKKEKS